MTPDGKREAPGKILPAFSLSAPQKSSPLQQSHKCDAVSESVDGGGTRGALLLPEVLCVQQWELPGHHWQVPEGSCATVAEPGCPKHCSATMPR